MLTRGGKPVAVLLSIQEYERLSRKYTGFWSAVSEFRRKVEDEGIDISDSDFRFCCIIAVLARTLCGTHEKSLNNNILVI